MNAVEGAVEFLRGRVAGVEVSGPLDLPPEGALGPLCVVTSQGPAGDEPLGNPTKTVRYLFRCYAADQVAALDAYEAIQAAAEVSPGVLVANVAVVSGAATKWLRWMKVSEPTGPLSEPETGRPLVAGTAVARWAS